MGSRRVKLKKGELTTLAVTLAWFFFNGCTSNLNKYIFYQVCVCVCVC
jgi:hypothetical protein